MFDDQNPKQPAPPSNLPTQEPPDMFAGIESEDVPAPAPLVGAESAFPNALNAGILKKKGSATLSPAAEQLPTDVIPQDQPVEYAAKAPVVGKIIMGVVILAALVGLGYGGWWGYNKFYLSGKSAANTMIPETAFIPPPLTSTPLPAASPSPETSTQNQIVLPSDSITTNTIDNAAKVQNESILFGEQIDTDKDGVPDTVEKQIGADPNNADTDKDGLNDGQEVNLWHTDPLSADSDADGYPDGQEIANGYNPLGAGKLITLPPGYSTSTAATSTR